MPSRVGPQRSASPVSSRQLSETVTGFKPSGKTHKSGNTLSVKGTLPDGTKVVIVVPSEGKPFATKGGVLDMRPLTRTELESLARSLADSPDKNTRQLAQELGLLGMAAAMQTHVTDLAKDHFAPSASTNIRRH